MMKIVFLVNGYYPSYSTNGICISKIIPFLKDKYEVHVIAIKGRQDEQTYYEKDGIFIHKVSPKEFTKRNKYNKNIINSKNVLINKSKLFLIRLQRYLSAFYNKENISKDLVDAFQNKLKDIGKINVIIPTCFPFEGLIAASNYKKTNSDVSVILHLFDKFTSSVSHQRTKLNMKVKFANHLKIEKEIFNLADAIIATNDWRTYIDEYHNSSINKTSFIEIPALNRVETPFEKVNSFDVLYAGVLDKKIRPPEKALKIIEKIVNIDKNINFHFMIKGNCSGIVQKYCDLLPNRIINYGTVSIEESYSMMSKVKVLLSIGNTDVTQTPSKIFEYMSMNKPIIHFYHDEKDRVIDLLSRYPRSLCIDLLSFEDIGQAEKVIQFINQDFSGQNISYDELVSMFPEANPEYASNVIEGLVNSGR